MRSGHVARQPRSIGLYPPGGRGSSHRWQELLARLCRGADVVPVPPLRDRPHVSPQWRLVGKVWAARMTRGTERDNPARAAPIGRIEDIAVHRQHGYDKAILTPIGTLLRGVTVASGGDLRWVEESGELWKNTRQGMARPCLVDLPPGPRTHVVPQSLPQLSDRPHQRRLDEARPGLARR